MVSQRMTNEQTTTPPATSPGLEWWARTAAGATVVLVACFTVPYLTPGPVGEVLWYIGLDGILWPGLAVILFLCGLVRSIRRRPFWTRWRLFGFVNLLLLFLFPFYVGVLSIFFIPYPTSRADSPSSPLVRQEKHECPSEMKGTRQGIARSPCSRPSDGWSNRSVEASEGKGVSHNASEPDSAPLSSGSGQPANEGEARHRSAK